MQYNWTETSPYQFVIGMLALCVNSPLARCIVDETGQCTSSDQLCQVLRLTELICWLSVNTCMVCSVLTVSGLLTVTVTPVVAEDPWQPPQPDDEVLSVLPVLPSGSAYRIILAIKKISRKEICCKIIYFLKFFMILIWFLK